MQVIEKLKVRFAAQSDADLATQLGVDKSTISSWKARGRVPDKYLLILHGGENSGFTAPPVRWGERESAAFSLALLRFSAVIQPHLNSSDLEKLSDWLPHYGAPFWAIFAICLDEIDAKMGAGTRSAKEASLLLIALDANDPDGARSRAQDAVDRIHGSFWSNM